MKGEENFLSLIAQPIIDTNHNLLLQLTQGQYKTANWYYDIITKQPKFVEFSYRDSVGGEMKTSNTKALIPKGIDENYSRIMQRLHKAYARNHTITKNRNPKK